MFVLLLLGTRGGHISAPFQILQCRSRRAYAALALLGLCCIAVVLVSFSYFRDYLYLT